MTGRYCTLLQTKGKDELCPDVRELAFPPPLTTGLNKHPALRLNKGRGAGIEVSVYLCQDFSQFIQAELLGIGTADDNIAHILSFKTGERGAHALGVGVLNQSVALRCHNRSITECRLAHAGYQERTVRINETVKESGCICSTDNVVELCIVELIHICMFCLC